MLCPSCQADNPSGNRFCEQCGTPLEARCPQCGASVRPGVRFCGACGQRLTGPEPVAPVHAVGPTVASQRQSQLAAYTPKHLAEKILKERSALEGERRQVTVLFADVAGFTALAEKLDPEEVHQIIDRCFDLITTEVHRFEGTINQYTGDGVMALFGAPIAHEDGPRRAVHAALGIQRALRDYSKELQSQRGLNLQMRIGINTGPVVVGRIGDDLRMDYTAVGDTTNLAARLQQSARPGSVLVSEATHKVIAGYFETLDLGGLPVKGHAPIRAFEVLRARGRRARLDVVAERGLTPLVGRERELNTLVDLFREVKAGRGQVVFIAGEAGIGKSRVVLEFRRALAQAGEEATWLQSWCVSFDQSIPFVPMIDQLRENFRIEEFDGEPEIIAKVEHGMRRMGELEAHIPYMRYLLGVDPGDPAILVMDASDRRKKMFEAVRALTRRGAALRPLILVWEDLQWMDSSTEEYLGSLMDSVAGVPLMLLLTYRVGYSPPFGSRSFYTTLTLHSLTEAETVAMAGRVLGTEHFPKELKAALMEKAEGVPLFVEEVAKTLLELGVLRRDNGGYRMVKGIAEVSVPDTIQGVLMARIDRLPDDSKRVLQTASVLGRDVSLRLLGALWEGPGVLDPHLLELKRVEFLYEKTGAGEPVYVFKHTLTQEVAYESLLTSRRRALHAAAGRALEALYADRLEKAYDRLAYHYSKTEEAAKAVEYLTRFAQKAARGYALVEAVAALQEALVHVERLPVEERDRRRLDLVLRQARSLSFLGRFPEVLELLLQHQERLEQLQESSLSGRFYLLLAHTYYLLGDHEPATQSAQRAVEEGKRCGNEATVGKAYALLTLGGFWSGQFHQGVEHGRQALTLLERTKERWWLGMAHHYLGINYLEMGEFELALDAEAKAQAIGEAVGDPHLQTFPAIHTGWLYAQVGAWEAGIEGCQRSLQRSTDPLNTATALGFLGYAFLEKGDPVEAIPVLERAIQLTSQFRYRPFQGLFTTFLAEASLLNGDIEKARALASQGLELTRDTKYWFGVGSAQRTLGRIAQASGALSEAETHLNEAFDTFASIQARFEMGRTHLALAELAHAQGNHEAAATHLKEAHHLFRTLRVPKYVERTEQLAREFGVALLQKPNQ